MRSHIEYFEGNEELLDQIELLWMKLNEHHQAVTKHFGESFSTFTFERRKSVLLDKVRGDSIKVDLAKDTVSGELVGYCLSTIVKTKFGLEGEIESIYIEPDYRGLSIADCFMKNALRWMDEREVEKRIVVVAYGNENVFGFYEKYGFFPRTTVLRQV